MVATALRRRLLSRAALAFALAAFSGCSDNASYLPKPRASADPEPAPAAAPTPTPAATPAGAPAVAAAPNAPAATPNSAAGQPAAAPNAPAAGATAGSTPVAATPLARRKEAVAKFYKLSVALERFKGRNARYPDQAVVDREGRWLLSWRVQLLPFLGHQDLYARFKLDEPWNSPHNNELLRQIPDVYRSPERRDEKTCFLLLTGPKTAYELPAGASDRLCPDGLINTILLAETNPELARPWTQPDDYTFNPLRIQADLFTHREDGALVLFGGEVGARLLPANVSDETLLGLITPNGKEKVDGASSSRELTPEPYDDLVQLVKDNPVARQLGNLLNAPPPAVAQAKPGAAGGAAASGGPAPSGSPDTPPAAGSESPVDSRLAPPAEDLITKAADEVRKLYADEYRTAKKAEDRKQFAKKLLDESKNVEADAPAFFVMLRAARDIAAPAGDLDTALAAQSKLLESFQLDEFATSFKLLETASPHLEDQSTVGKLYDEATRLADLALERDDFAGAKQAISMAQGAARRLRQQEDLATANRREDEINAARLAFQKIAPHLHSLLRSPDQPTACAAVGRYTALVKRDWTKGLQLLAKGDDLTLRKLATDDLSAPEDQELQAALADAWWEWAEQTPSAMEKSNARLRAVHWYKLAIPGLPPSLSRVRAERRTAEVEAPAEKRQARRS